MLRAFLKKRADNREYKRTFDDCLLLLFHAFPDALPSLKRGVDLTDMMRSLQADGSNARESSVHAATMLIGPLLASLSGAERQAALEAFEREERKVRTDFDAKGVEQSDHQIRSIIGEMMAEAVRQIEAEAKS